MVLGPRGAKYLLVLAPPAGCGKKTRRRAPCLFSPGRAAGFHAASMDCTLAGTRPRLTASGRVSCVPMPWAALGSLGRLLYNRPPEGHSRPPGACEQAWCETSFPSGQGARQFHILASDNRQETLLAMIGRWVRSFPVLFVDQASKTGRKFPRKNCKESTSPEKRGFSAQGITTYDAMKL